MAGLTTSTFPTKPLRSRPNPLSLSSFSSNLFGLHIHNPNTSSNLKFQISSSNLSISARYGGGGGGNRRPWEKKSEEDDGLDLSTIRSENVRLIDERQNMVGIVPKGEALRMAEDAELDLVLLSPDADPPVVKLLDYNKYKYEQQKKKRDQQKKAAGHRVDLKELKMGYNIDVHDYAVRLRAALKFLKAGDKVKVIVNLKGRERDFKKNALELLGRFQTDIGELAVEESRSIRERSMTLVMVPNKNFVQKAKELTKKNEEPVSTEEVSAGVGTESVSTEEVEEVSAGVSVPLETS